jgi:hypothetical protein
MATHFTDGKPLFLCESPTFRLTEQSSVLAWVVLELAAFCLSLSLKCVDEGVTLRDLNEKANPIYLIWQTKWGNS